MGGESSGKEMSKSCWLVQKRFHRICSICCEGKWGEADLQGCAFQAGFGERGVSRMGQRPGFVLQARCCMLALPLLSTDSFSPVRLLASFLDSIDSQGREEIESLVGRELLLQNRGAWELAVRGIL